MPPLTVPILVPNACFDACMKTRDEKLKSSGCLVLVAFYYLPYVGEYTKPWTTIQNGEHIRATQTKQFTVANAGFFKNGQIAVP
jgi:hypothetical protein